MTTMITITSIPAPNPNNEESISQHKGRVLDAYGPLFDLIDQALRVSVRRAIDLFRLLDGPVDLGVHATLTRYLTKKCLDSEDVPTENEDVVDFELKHVSNCGLCLLGPGHEIRILKSTSDGIPKASSDARSRFYCSNQFQLAFANSQPDAPPELTLSLVVLWSMDDSYAYEGLEIACPRGERRDGTVDCYWRVEWKRAAGISTISTAAPNTPEPDLDEIRAVPTRQILSS